METTEATPTFYNEHFDKFKHSRYLRLIAGAVLLMCIGICNAWSVLNAPISREFANWSQGTLQMTFTIFMMSFATFGLLGGWLVRKLKTVRINLIIASVLVLSTFIVSSLAQSPIVLYIGFGVLGGAGVVFAYNAVVVNITKWFPDRTGIAVGILLMGYGLGPFIIGLVYSKIINSGTDWRTVFTFFGIITSIVVMAGVFIITPPPKEYAAPPIVPKIDKKSIETLECTPLRMMKRPSFWLLFGMGTFSSMAGMGIISNGRNLLLAVDGALSLDKIALYVGMISIASAIGRVSTGFINDWGGLRFNVVVSACSVFFGILLVTLAVAVGSLPFLVVAFAIMGFCAGMSIDDGAVVTKKFFGEANFQINLQVVMFCGIFNAFGATIIGGLYDLSGGYIVPLLVLAGMALVGAVCGILLRKP